MLFLLKPYSFRVYERFLRSVLFDNALGKIEATLSTYVPQIQNDETEDEVSQVLLLISI